MNHQLKGRYPCWPSEPNPLPPTLDDVGVGVVGPWHGPRPFSGLPISQGALRQRKPSRRIRVIGSLL